MPSFSHALGATLLFAASTLSGAAMAQSPLSAASVTVQRYDTLPNFSGDSGIFCCATHIQQSGPDADFVHVRAVFDVAFSETIDRVQVNSADVLMLFPGAEEGQRAVGRFDHMPVFEFGSPSIFVNRPRDWPEETAQAFIDGVWIVPAGQTSATLQVGPADARIDVPLDRTVPVTSVMPPRMTVAVEVTGFGAVDTITLDDRYNGQDMPGVLEPGIGGRFLRLSVSVTPRMSTATDAQTGENRFLMYGNYIRITGPDGVPLPFVGTDTGRSVRTRWSVSSTWENETRPIELSNYYIGTAEPGRYSIYYLSDKVAEFIVE
jgi:hypothetical protein